MCQSRSAHIIYTGKDWKSESDVYIGIYRSRLNENRKFEAYERVNKTRTMVAASQAD